MSELPHTSGYTLIGPDGHRTHVGEREGRRILRDYNAILITRPRSRVIELFEHANDAGYELRVKPGAGGFTQVRRMPMSGTRRKAG